MPRWLLPLQGYQTFWNQTQNPSFAGYVGGFNRFRHYSRLNTPADTDIVTPNNNTPYSWAWLDLRAEPIVLELPAVAAPFIDENETKFYGLSRFDQSFLS